MNQSIEPMPTEAVLKTCQKAWDLTDISYVRKMENIVFCCQRHGQKVFLRLTTPLRRTKEQIKSELHFIRHLGQTDLHVPNIINNNDGQSQMTIQDAPQPFEAVVFSEITGMHPTKEMFLDETYQQTLGKIIATMHQVSRQYEPLSGGREHWFEERGIRHAKQAAKISNQSHLRESFEKYIHWMEGLEKTSTTYGLIHSDMTPTNLFMMPNGTIGIIDFDDACYHFFAFDLAIAINAMANFFFHPHFDEQEHQWLDNLITGYRQILPIEDDIISQIPHFIQFACLRLYFWIESHQNLNTFHKDAIERVLKMKQWAYERVQR